MSIKCCLSTLAMLSYLQTAFARPFNEKITGFPRNGSNGVTRAVFSWWSSEVREDSNSTTTMAASPGNMYQKQALKKRPTSYLQPSSGSLPKPDRYKEKDIPLNSTQPPSSPTMERGSNISLRKFSQISLHSDASDAADLHTPDANSNTHKKHHIGTPKNAIRKIHHQVWYSWMSWKMTKLFRVKFIVRRCFDVFWKTEVLFT